MKYFVDASDDEYVWHLTMFRDRILDGEEEIILLEMKRDIGGEMFCQEFFDFPNACGAHCPYYHPCNGVSGRCRHLKNGFIGTGRKFRLTAEKLEEIT